jgi:hypothetical protein
LRRHIIHITSILTNNNNNSKSHSIGWWRTNLFYLYSLNQSINGWWHVTFSSLIDSTCTALNKRLLRIFIYTRIKCN